MTTLTHDNTTIDPWRRLLAAVVVRAVQDVHLVEKRTPQRAQRSAREFLADRRVRALCEDHIEVPREVWARAELQEQPKESRRTA
jgi:hypothetical protein